jgi:3',5'-cyclic AMP phosphodiesterase CpdA
VLVGLVIACRHELPEGWLLVAEVTTSSATISGTRPLPETVSCRASDSRPASGTVRRRGRGLWSVGLHGLSPGTRYRCRLDVPMHAERPAISFRTPGLGPTHLTFAAVGDSGDGSGAAVTLARRIAARRPDFLAHLGDLAYPRATASAIDRRFFQPYGPLLRETAIVPVPGNHDLRWGSVYRLLFDGAALARSPSRLHYAFDWGPAHFTVLSSREFADASAAERAWLHGDLERARGRPWQIVLLHDPLYSPGGKWSPRMRALLGPLIEATGVDLVLAGHQHLYARTRPICAEERRGGTVQIVSGGGGANLDAVGAHPNFPRVVSTTHYVLVRVGPERLDAKAVDVDGRVIDRFRLLRGTGALCRPVGWAPLRLSSGPPRPRASRGGSASAAR